MNPSSLSEEENKQAEEAKQRALDILTDALRKKAYVLVENPEDFTHHPKYKDFPLISPSLVRDLICELHKATFMRSSCNIDKGWFAYVYPTSHERIIYLCPRFWSNNVLLGIESRPLTVIHEVSHFLGYEHSAEETLVNASNNHFHQWKLLPLATSDIESAFVNFMSHRGTYEFDSYNCCGERARDSALDDVEETERQVEKMTRIFRYVAISVYCKASRKLKAHSISGNRTSTTMVSLTCSWKRLFEPSLSKKEHKEAEEAKQRTLKILNDALKKKDHLLVKHPKEFNYLCCGRIALISPRLVRDLITELQKVTFKRGSSKKGGNCIAYVYPDSDERVIYLCPPFWKESELLGTDSRPIAIIHEVAHFLGYDHTVLKTMANKRKIPFTQWKQLPLATCNIESAFAEHMIHNGVYVDGSYSCCGERARDSVCVKSEMGFHLRIQKLFHMNLIDHGHHILHSLLNDWKMIVKPQGGRGLLQINFPERSIHYKPNGINVETSVADS